MFGQKALLMELGTGHVKLGTATYKNGVVHLEKAVLVDLPADTYHDGRIMDMEVLRGRIFNALEDNGLKVKETYLTLNGSHVITREIVLPDVPEAELAEMVTYEIQQHMPINLEQYHLEFKVLERFEEEAAKKVRIMVASISKAEVDSYYQLLLLLQLKPMVLDISGNALSKLFTGQTSVNRGEALGNRCVALVDLGKHAFTVTIVQGGVLHLSRLIEAESSELEALTDTSQAESVDYSVWVGRIQRVFQFYATRYVGSRVEQVYLFGGLANNEILVQYLNDNLGVPAEIVESVSTVALDGQAAKVDMKRYLNMLGALAREK